MQKSLIPALGGGASFLGSVAVQLLVPSAPSWVGWGLAGLALALLALAVGLWLAEHPRAEGGKGGIDQDSRGPHSPNFGHVGGNVIINPAPAEPSAKVQHPYDIEKVTEVLRGALEKRPGPVIKPLNQDTADRMREAANPKPDLPLTGLLIRLYKAMGGAPEQGKEAFYRKVNLAILDSIEHDGLKIWARAGEKALKPLDDYDLEHASIDHRKNEVRIPVGYGTDRVLEDLHFNQSQVDKIWPKEAETR